MARRDPALSEFVDRQLYKMLSGKRDLDYDYTSIKITQRILRSDSATDVQYVQRRIGALRHRQLALIRENIRNGNRDYRPEFFPASKKIDNKSWCYLNACDEPHFTDVMKIYRHRADGLNGVADVMEMV